jgi:hypothetical protein
MVKLGFSRFFAGLFLFFIAFCGRATESETQAPDFKEVYELIRTHLAGMSETDLNRTAVQALVSALGSKVSLAGPETSESGGEKALVSKSALFEGKIGYLRVNQVGSGLEKALREAYEKVGATNKLNGLVIDLRYATGDNYAAAAAAADLFLKREEPLMDWGQGMVKSKEKTDAISLPVSVLINGETAGAAEGLAAVLRETGTGLILGNKSAGRAMIAQEYPLQNGGRLRIATAPLQLGDGSALPLDGLKPDVVVEVNPEQERIYYTDAFKELSKSNVLTASSASSLNPANSTNRNRRARFNEAELVRERREGFAPDLELPADSGENADKPVVRDPVLARGLDVLKGLAVVRQSHS